MEERKSLYKQAAENGIPLGLYMSTISLMTIYADIVPFFSVIAIVLLFAGPVVIYRFQRKYFIEQGGMAEYAALWMLGIMMVIFGAIITGAVTYCVIEFVRPNYLYDQAQATLDAYNALPEMRAKLGDMLDIMQAMVEQNALPSAIELVFNMFWFVTFSGSVLSAITAAFASRRL
ncbi:MAG: DUF4199 domain-containing protein [Muribaculaceae bacterium]|nr:DUF4199 domain-containing protein [Muribaculaceae bacterium]